MGRLVGVVAGALFAFAGQYVLRRIEKQDRYDALLLEQFTCIIGLSEDFRNRIWEERKQVASDVVSKWDLAAYRRAEALLRILSPKSRSARRLEISMMQELTLARHGGPSPATSRPSTAYWLIIGRPLKSSWMRVRTSCSTELPLSFSGFPAPGNKVPPDW
jgi:hypothetical protein